MLKKIKDFSPRGLWGGDLRKMMDELLATPAMLAKLLDVNERTVWRWLKEDNAPKMALLAIWHATPAGRLEASTHVGNALSLERVINNDLRKTHASICRQVAQVLALCSTGAANDPILNLPRHIPALKHAYTDDVQLSLYVYDEPPRARPSQRQIEMLFN